MTTVAKLLARKQVLLERLQEARPNEREEIERRLEQINSALNSLDKMVPETSDEQ